MKLKVERLYPKEDYTIGKMYIDGKYFCDTLEDAERDIERDGKIPQKTAIPKGEYTVIFNMSPRFGRNLPRLLDVPHFDGILIHPGNTADDSAGCILVGRNTVKGALTDSRIISDRLNALIEKAQRHGEKITIEIV